MMVGDTAEAPVRAAAADGRRSLRDLLVMRRLVQRESRVCPTFYTAFCHYCESLSLTC